MALIKCPECGKEISDKAEACPNCGCLIDKREEKMTVPVEVNSETAAIEKNEKPVKKDTNAKRIIIIAVSIIVLLAAGGVGFYLLTDNWRDYSAAVKDYDNNKYKDAIGKFESLGEYKDSEEMLKRVTYEYGKDLYNNQEYNEAKIYFEKLENYEDCQKLVSDCEYELTVDGQFMRALSNGLMKRWDKNDEYEAQGKVSEDPTIYSEFCDIELDMVESFYNQPFSNEKLGEDVKIYIDLLNSAKEATKYYTIDYTTYSTKWAEVYAKRTMLLQKFIDDYGLKVDEQHQTTLEGISSDASAATEQTQAKETIHNMTNEFQLTIAKEEWGYKTYKLQMKNTTEYTFDYFYVEIALLDQSGKIVDTGSATQITSWKPSQEAEVEAYLNSQSSLDGYTVQYTPHYQSGTLYE